MGFDKGTITNGTVVTISLLALVGLLVVGATPAAAQSNGTDDGPPEFDFNLDDGESFGFDGENSSGDAPEFNFGDISDGSSFDFSGIGENGDGSDFSGIAGDGEAPDFSGIGDDSDGTDFSGIAGDGEAPDFSGIAGDGDGSDFGGIGDIGDAPDFSGIGGDDGDDDDGQNGGDNGGEDTNETSPANFQVSNLNAPAEATVGDTITVSADVENVGGSEGAQTVSFGVDTDDDGTLEDLASQEETLASGASTTVMFEVNTSALAAGTYTHGVSTTNDTAEAEITLESQQTDQPANFQIQTIETNSPVTEGENVTVEATIENTGDEEGTQRMRISFFGTTSQPVKTLAAGQSRVISLSVQTLSGDAGTYEATVETDDDSATTNVTVTEPGVSGTVEGTVSDASGSAIDGATVSAGDQSATTSADGSYTLTLDAGDYTVEATAQGYNTSSQDVTVTAGETTTADFTLSESVTATGTVEGTVVNVSSGNGIDGATVSAGSQSTTTSADGSYTLTLETGDYTVEATAQGYNTSSQPVTVTEGGTTTANFHLQSTDSDTGVPEYQSFTAYAESGYLQVGNNSLRSDLPDCPNGEPANESKGCVRFTADLNPDTGEYTVEPENFHFPPIPFEDTTLGTVMANNTATETITGNLNLETGEGSFNAPIFSYLEEDALDEGCGLEVNVQGTTGQSGNISGEPGALQPNGTARATLVDGTFSIPEATDESCGYFSGSVNDDVGLPAFSGENEIVQDLYLVFHEESVSEVTDDN